MQIKISVGLIGLKLQLLLKPKLMNILQLFIKPKPKKKKKKVNKVKELKEQEEIKSKKIIREEYVLKKDFWGFYIKHREDGFAEFWAHQEAEQSFEWNKVEEKDIFLGTFRNGEFHPEPGFYELPRIFQRAGERLRRKMLGLNWQRDYGLDD